LPVSSAAVEVTAIIEITRRGRETPSSLMPILEDTIYGRASLFQPSFFARSFILIYYEYELIAAACLL
jgi:hypothetical protein